MELNVVITGGSRGLGLALARTWANRGANVAICGRDADSLALAQQDLQRPNQKTLSVSCDVGDPEAVELFLNRVAEELGEIDVLINNAGVITVGPVDEQRLVGFEEAMHTMYWGTAYTSLAVLPKMLERGSGHIVNITSIGGKISAPHLLPYSCAKAAAIAFSNGRQSEHASSGVHVMTVIPGFMRSGSQDHAHFLGNVADEYKWFTLAGNLPFASISVDQAAKRIVQATVANKRRLVITPVAQAVARLVDLAPIFTSRALDMVNRHLPHPQPAEHAFPVEGKELPRVEPDLIAHVEEKAASRHNQHKNQEETSMETNVVDLLKADHQKVEKLFSELDSKSPSELENYFCGLREELVRHEVAEELIVYPAFREHVPEGDAIAESCIQEQSMAEEKLASLEKQDASTESFKTQLKELRQAVLSHAKHEESDVFPALASHVESGELEQLGKRYQHALEAAPTHPHPHAPDTPPGNVVLGPIAALVDRMRDAMRGAA